MKKKQQKSQLTSIKLDSVTLQVNQIIDYSVGNKIFKGKIVEFSETGISGWAKLENVVDQSIEWISLYNWKESYDKGLFSKVAEAFMSTTQATEIHI
jgi:hypothetical protein